MKRVIKYLLAILLTAWKGALTIFIGVCALVWITELAMVVAESGVLAVAALCAALIVLTVWVSEAATKLVHKWDKKD